MHTSMTKKPTPQNYHGLHLFVCFFLLERVTSNFWVENITISKAFFLAELIDWLSRFVVYYSMENNHENRGRNHNQMTNCVQ